MKDLKEALEYIEHLELDNMRLLWMTLNNVRVLLINDWYDIHDNDGTYIVQLKKNWRDAIDKAMEEDYAEA